MSAEYRYKPPAMKKTGPLRARLSGFVSLCLGGLRRVVARRKGTKKSPLARQKRTWRLRKLTHRLSLSLLVLALLACCGRVAFTLLSRSDFFQASEVAVVGSSIATRQQVLEAGGLNRRINLLALDTERAENLILAHPWIEEVTVRRRWPSSLEVTVREHKPLALVNLEHDDERSLYYMDSKGVLFAPHAPALDPDYPVVTGLTLDGSQRGMRLATDSLAFLAVEFLNLAAQGNQILPLQAVSEVHVSGEKGLIVYLVDHPFPIYMGREDVKSRFRQLVRVLAQLYREDRVKDIREIRMNYAENKILVANTGT